jgi:hypothetical protein
LGEHALTVGYGEPHRDRRSWSPTRDALARLRARFTNLIAEPTLGEAVTEAVNDTLKAIAASLLMEQVLAPRFEFAEESKAAPRLASTTAKAATTRQVQCRLQRGAGQFQIEIKGLCRRRARRRAHLLADLERGHRRLRPDKTAIERAFRPGAVPEELTQLRMGKIIKDKYRA